MSRISFIIPVVNNFKYTKHIYNNLKEYYPNDEIVISDGGSEDETQEYFSSLKDNNLIYIRNPKLNLGENYNRGVEGATEDIVVLLHNDMYVPPLFKDKLLSSLTTSNIISFSRIEPPIFPQEEPGKIVRDFGYDLETLDKIKVDEFDKTYNEKYKGGGYLFIACYKKNWIKLDEVTFTPPQMWAADDDLHLRFKLSGFELLISDALVYHFVSKTSRTKDYEIGEGYSNKNFVRKWGIRNVNKGVVKYNIAYVVEKCNLKLLEILEPWCDRIYIDDNTNTLISQYIDKEQSNTTFNLKKRVLRVDHNSPSGENDIIISFDGSELNLQNFSLLQNFPQIIKESGSIGKFELDIFKIEINSLTEYQDSLIKF